jgi:hypothetical protein
MSRPKMSFRFAKPLTTSILASFFPVDRNRVPAEARRDRARRVQADDSYQRRDIFDTR